jgi:hypothetical protein
MYVPTYSMYATCTKIDTSKIFYRFAGYLCTYMIQEKYFASFQFLHFPGKSEHLPISLKVGSSKQFKKLLTEWKLEPCHSVGNQLAILRWVRHDFYVEKLLSHAVQS